MSDLISRQDAIESLHRIKAYNKQANNLLCADEDAIEKWINELPSAQPEDYHKMNVAEYIHDFYPDVWRHAEKELEVKEDASKDR